MLRADSQQSHLAAAAHFILVMWSMLGFSMASQSSVGLTRTLEVVSRAQKQESIRGTARVLQGTIDELSTSSGVRSGAFTISWEDGLEWPTQRVIIADGRWVLNCAVADGALVFVSDIVVEDAPAFLLGDGFTSIEITRKRPIDLTFFRPRRVSLNVVDSRSLQPLRDIEVQQADSGGFVYRNEEIPRLNECGVAVANPQNPVELHPQGGGQLYFVRAKGHAWTSVLVDHRYGGSRLVCLESGGTVQLKLRGGEQPLAASDHLWIALWRQVGGVEIRLTAVESSGSADPAPLEGVPAGEVIIGWSTLGVMAATTDAQRIKHAQVAEMKSTAVELECGEELVTQPVLVTVLCEVDVPDELMPTDADRQLLLVAARQRREYAPVAGSLDASRTATAPGRSRFSSRFESIPSGDYFLSGTSPPVLLKVHVGTCDAQVSYRVEECGTVRLAASGGAVPKLDRLQWSMCDPGGLLGLPMPATYDYDSREWVVHAPVGRVLLMGTNADPAATGQQELGVTPGKSRGELKLVWESRTLIRPTDAGVHVLFPPGYWESAVVTTSEGRLITRTPWRTTVSGFTGDGEILFGHEGDVIQLSAPPGYERPEPIRVPAGGYPKGATVTLALVRRHQ